MVLFSLIFNITVIITKIEPIAIAIQQSIQNQQEKSHRGEDNA